jgi:glyoxylase I family protein
MLTAAPGADGRKIPSGPHHVAYVVDDLAATRHFYEDLIGLPLQATYCETNEIANSYCHCFFEYGSNGALAFFQFADPAMKAKWKREPLNSLFYHIALRCDRDVQQGIRDRVAAASYAGQVVEVDHGYCQSLYITDPDGLIIEFTVDAEGVDHGSRVFKQAHDELQRWLAGDHTPNNVMRAHAS